MIGKKFKNDQYEIIKYLGEGGFGVVFQVKDSKDNKNKM
jgi:serine/threonine protein kinase